MLKINFSLIGNCVSPQANTATVVMSSVIPVGIVIIIVVIMLVVGALVVTKTLRRKQPTTSADSELKVCREACMFIY